MNFELSSFFALAGLGAFHGINPGMGWLFAVALGLQERQRGAVWRALVPLGAGHLAAVAAAVGAAAVSGLVVPLDRLTYVVAFLLVGLGCRRLVRHDHPRGVGMRVGWIGLGAWSFLMASAHGAGLMVVPFVIGLGATPAGAAAACHTAAPWVAGTGAAVAGTLVHGAGYLAVTAVTAVLVYEKLGVGILRTAWVNLDLIWAIALIITGVLTVAL
jgi:hypothetical protein